MKSGEGRNPYSNCNRIQGWRLPVTLPDPARTSTTWSYHGKLQVWRCELFHCRDLKCSYLVTYQGHLMITLNTFLPYCPFKAITYSPISKAFLRAPRAARKGIISFFCQPSFGSSCSNAFFFFWKIEMSWPEWTLFFFFYSRNLKNTTKQKLVQSMSQHSVEVKHLRCKWWERSVIWWRNKDVKEQDRWTKTRCMIHNNNDWRPAAMPKEDKW